MLVCALGDLLLDVVVRVERPLARDTDTFARVAVGCGGQAANVAAWARALGAEARVVAARARDLAGRLLEEELRRRGVDLAGPSLVGATGTVVSVATPDGERAMLTDRGVAPLLEDGRLAATWLAGADWLHVSGYTLASDAARVTAVAAAKRARERRAGVSLDLSSVAAIDRAGVGPFRDACAAVGPDVVFATEAERARLGGLDAESWVVKRGAGGFAVERAGASERYEALAAEVVDGTGAGDALAAGFLVGGPELAREAAARCVSALGALPP